MSETSQLLKAALAVGVAIVEAVRAAGPLGAPGGVLYAALSAQGCSLEQFERIMGNLVGAGVLVKCGQVYRVGPAAELKGGAGA